MRRKSQTAATETPGSASLEALERRIEAGLDLLEPGSVTAFHTGTGSDVGVVVEVSAALRRMLQPDALAQAIRETLAPANAPTVLILAEAPPAREGASNEARRAGREVDAREAYAQQWRDGRLRGFAAYSGGQRSLESAPTADAAPQLARALTETELQLDSIWREVLRQEAIDPDQNFFALGGNSITAAQILARVRERLAVPLDYAGLTGAATLRELAGVVERLRGERDASVAAPIALVPRDRRLALSPVQRQMHLLWQLDPDSGAYNVSGALRLHGALDFSALQQTFDALVQRHEALRTRFPRSSLPDQPADDVYQHIDAPYPVAIRRVDLPARQTLQAWLSAEALEPFDLARGPLMRVLLVRLGQAEHALAVTLHHSIADGSSMNLLVEEFAQLYAAYAAAQVPELPALPLQYADYASWQSARLEAGEGSRQLEYWRRTLGDEHPVLALPSDRPRPRRPSQRGERLDFALPAALVRDVRKLARAHKVSVSVVLLSAFEVLLHRYTQERAVRVGVVGANRARSEAERLLGAFVNTQVLQTRISLRASFVQLLAQVSATLAEAQAHQDLPFERLVEALQPERSAAHNPLFQVMYNHQQRDLRALDRLPGLSVELLEVDTPVARFDLSLNTLEAPNGALSAWFVYATDLFERARLRRMAAHYRQLLAALVANAERPIAAVSWLSEAERQQLDSFGRAKPQLRSAGFVHAWIEERARRNPDASALVFGTESLTYGELERRAEQLACRLIEEGAGPDRVIGVLLPRSIELVITLLAILKSGAAYLPLDPEYPRERIAYMLEDSGVQLLVTRSDLRDVVAAYPERSVLEVGASATSQAGLSVPRSAPDVDTPSAVSCDGVVALRRRPQLHRHNLAYVLYTSGTTGLPKAVGNTHGALADRLSWMRDEYRLGRDETLLLKTPLGFDVAVWEVFWPLAVGARLAIAAPGDQRDPQQLARLIQRHAVSTIHFVPSLLREFVAQPEARRCRSLRRVFSGGEALSPELQAQVLERMPNVRLDNRYGPTEALINATYWTCRRDAHHSVPIGRPIPSTSVRILDAALLPVPLGVPGELYIGGACLARGYHGRAGLTAERFIPDPFSPRVGERLYRSGDWARFREDGAIEYLGRRDDQVKVRGVRIELGEIEAALCTLPAVESAVALIRPGPGGNPRIVAYVTGAGRLDPGGLLAALEQRVPAQLVPAQIMPIAALPRLPSGKLDRAALPEPVWQTREHSAPATELENRLANLWQAMLQVERVGRHDDFFALGGHSLLATQLVSRVRAAFDLELPLRELFDAPKLAEFALRVQRALDQGQRQRQPAIEPADRSRPLPLSYAQERMWFLWSLDPNSPAYNVGGAVRLSGALNALALERALQAMVERHEALRTIFPRDGSQPVQRIADCALLPVERVDLRAVAASERESAWRAWAAREAERPFDLEQGPLLRAALLQLAPEMSVLVLTLHHIIAEGWAMDVFARECASLYEAFAQGLPSPLPALPVQYPDYAAWQRRWLDSGEAERQLDYWRRKLGTEHPVLELPSDHPRPAVRSQRGDYHRFELDPSFSEQVRSFGLRQGATLSMTLMAALSAFIHRYSGERELRIGYPIANRTRPEFEGLIGAFLNTQVLRCELSSELTVAELVARVRLASLDAQEHQDVPFHHIVEAVAPRRSAAHTPLFQVMCNVQSWQFQQTRSVAGLTLEFIVNDAAAAQFDLALDVSDVNGRIECGLSYSLDLFERETVERMARHVVVLLRGMVEAPHRKIGDLPLQSAQEIARHLRLAQAVEPSAESTEQCLHMLFERQVERTPEAVAVVFGDRSLRYRELNSRANRLARHLRARGVRTEDRIGLLVERSLEAVVAVLGVLKAGASHVPLDPENPPERIAFGVSDSGLALILTQERLRDRVPDSVETVWLERDFSELSDANLELSSAPEQLAYCIYTSGSTGRPKAVGNTHRGLVNRLRAQQSLLALTPSDRLLQKTPFSFDVSVSELLWPLLTGASLVVAPVDAHRDPEALKAEILRHAVTTLDFVPSMLQAFVDAGALEVCSTLRFITVGGEVLSPELAARIGLPLYNMYGPTEAAIDTAFWRCSGETNLVPIGRPWAGTQLHVLDPRMLPVPFGVTGELYIGGVGLARGYLGRSTLTAERFVPDPFGSHGGRLYRSGDLARRRTDGVLEFVGRADHQIKLRGYRIELGEIEARLSAHSRVAQAVVVVRTSGAGMQLVAYVVAAPGVDPGALADLRDELCRDLPDYMVPARIVALTELPRTPSGKLDRAALPEPELANSDDYVEPESELERKLAQIWCAVLDLPRVSVHDNFFELGGDSIVSLQVISRAREAGLQLAPRDVFQHQTLRALAGALGSGTPVVADAGPAQGSVALTPIQRRFFAEPMAARHHYNQALLLRPKRALDAKLCARALEVLVEHHDALRLRFSQHAEGCWQQRYAEQTQWPLLEWTLGSDALADDLQRGLDLVTGPLQRAALFTLGDGSQRLLLAIHHLVVDGVSWRILLEDLERVYSQLEAADPVVLPARTASYQRWSEQLLAYADSPGLAGEIAHWKCQLAADGIGEIPRDFANEHASVGQSAELSLCLSPELTGQLLRQAPAAYRTQVNDLLLNALARAVCSWSGDDSVLVELEAHGREAVGGVELDLSRSVGWFTNLFPVRLTPIAGDDAGQIAASIKHVKEQLRAAPQRGLGFGVLQYLARPELRAQLGEGATPRITFNYLGQFDQSFSASSLFELAGESTGPNQDERTPLGNWLSIYGRVSGEQLTLTLRFSTAMYRTGTIARLLDAYQRELTRSIEHCVAAVAGGATPCDFPLASLTQDQLDRLQLAARGVEDVYPLSPLQRGILFHSLYDREPSELYVSQLNVDVDGLDLPRFSQAWQAAVARHTILRTSFVELERGSGFVQIVHERATLPIEELELDATVDPSNEPDVVRALAEVAARERARGFELERAPLLRLLSVRHGAQRRRLILTHHHVLLDGWSVARLLEEVLRTYAGERVPSQPGAYRRFIAWLLQRDRAADERFWKAQLAPLDAPSLLGAALPPGPSGGGTSSVRVQLSAAETNTLQRFAKRERVTLNTLIQGAWAILLQRYTGQSTVTFGATVAGRPAELSGIERAVGLFINTVPVVLRPAPERPLASWLREVQGQNLALREHEYAALSDIQRWAGKPGQALFDTLLVFENYPIDRALRERGGSGLRFGEVHSVDETHYALTLEVILSGAQLALTFKGSRAQLDPAQLPSLVERFSQLLGALARRPAQALAAFALSSPAELAQLQVWNDTSVRAASGGPELVHRWFEARAQIAPDAAALLCGDVSLTYRELDARANRLAHHLRESGVGPDVLVGLCAQRSIEMVVGLLAILKAGGAYLPLDPAYPRERLRSMIEDSGIRLLITQQALLPSLPETEARAWCIDRDWNDVPPLSAAPPTAAMHDQHLAYCIYTSGSTGKPKGVQLTHRGFSNYVAWALQAYRLAEIDGSALHSSIAFDLTVTSLWLPLCAGKRVDLTPDEGDALAALASTLQSGEAPTRLLKITPAHALALLELLERPLPELRALVVGGEALSWECVAALGRIAPQARVINEYGPTEAVVGCCIHDATADADSSRARSVPIGSPIANTQLFVLDRCFQPAAVGVAGELCIGGAGLARGYRNRPAQTAERFVPNPLATSPGERLYRSGDLARYRADGVLEYLGRIDHQVKIRGYRIELGEIEACLCERTAVRDAAVLARDDGHGKQLVAYVVAAVGSEDRARFAEQLREQLALVLPSYMVPARILVLDALPLTENGKLDRRALPAPSFHASAEYVEPVDEIERQLAGVFAAVLGSARVGRFDNFFDLGGDSILSLQIVSRARAAGLAIAPKDVFEHQTVEALARTLQADAPAPSPALPAQRPSAGFDCLAMVTPAEIERLPLPASELEDVYPLSPIQHGMLFHALYSADSGDYVNQLSVAVEGLDVERFREAWRATIVARPILRTCFMDLGGERGHVQVVLRTAPVPIEELDWRGREVSDVALQEIARQEHARGLALERPPLQRLLLIRTGERRHQLIWTHHHVLLDGWSNARLIEDVFGYYATNALSERAGHFRDYIAWLQRQDPAASERFWRSQLQALDEPTLLAGALPHGEAGSGHAQQSIELSAQHTADLQRFAQRERITLNTLIQGAWLLLLQQYTGQRSVGFGATVAGRPAGLAGAFDALGMFINTLPVIQTVDPTRPLADWLRQLQRHNLALRDHEHCPLFDVQRWGGRKGQELFDTIVVFENYPVEQVLAGLASERLRFEPSTDSANPTNYSLSLMVFPGAQLSLQFAYRRDRLDARQIATLAGRFQQWLKTMLRSPTRPLGTLSLSSAADLTQLAGWNNTRLRVADPLPVHQWVEKHAREQPDQVAVSLADACWTYAELNAKANRLARWLRGQGVGPDVLVGICVERSPEMVLGVLAIQKAGGAYLPIDPDYPAERVAYLIESSGIRLLLTQTHLLSAAPPTAIGIFCLDRPADALERFSPSDLGIGAMPEQLSYCIYTSGSTGEPKAAENTHAALDNRLNWMQAEYALTPSDRVLHKTPFGFDIAVAELLWPLRAGARIVMLPPGAQRDPAAIAATIREQGVTVLDFVASMLRAFVETDELAACSSLRLVTTGAEEVPSELAREFRARHRARLVNEYGPTEAAIAVTYWDCRPSDETAVSPIGRPIANTQLFVLDATMNALPAGLSGELYIAGDNLARGYRARPALTAERFVPHPYASRPGQRLYRSGDLARWRSDGVLEYLGRVDQQVKIRGHRIELGEIEARLREFDAVAEAVAVARDVAGLKQLVAYVATPTEPAVYPEFTRGLAERLQRVLPAFMLPARIVALATLPLTPNGKLDRRALPAPEWTDDAAYVEPSSAIERQLAAIWADVLGLPRVGKRDQFFVLGGDSISCLRVVSRARQLGLTLTPRDVFSNPTIEALAALVEGSAPAQGDVPLSPAQRALLAKPTEAAVHTLTLHSGGPLDAARLERALRSVVEQHAALRLRIWLDDDGGWRQTHAERAAWDRGPLLWTIYGDLARCVEEARASLSLSDGPLLRGVLVRSDDSQALPTPAGASPAESPPTPPAAAGDQLLVVIHALVADAESCRIVLEDLQRAYAQPDSVDVGTSTGSFEHWSEAVAREAQRDLSEALIFWRDHLAPRGTAGGSSEALPPRLNARARLVLDRELSEWLLDEAHRAYRTQLEDLLLTGLARVVCRTRQKDAVIVERSTRPALQLDLERSVGVFASAYPVRLEPALGASPEELAASIKDVKEQLRSAERRGLSHAVLLHLADSSTREQMRRQPRAELRFEHVAARPIAEGPYFSSAELVANPVPGGSEISLAIETSLLDGALVIEARYAEESWSARAIRQLLRDYRAELASLVEHCTRAESAMTPSDIIGGQLDQRDIDALLQDLA